MYDFKIKAVINPKGKKSTEGESIYICINKKIRKYINLNLEKIPKQAWNGKPLKWVNNKYSYSDSHNLVINRAIHNLKEIIQDHLRRDEVLTAEKLKKIYEVKYQGKKIRGISGLMAPGASDTVTSYIGYFLNSERSIKLAPNTRKVYVTLRKLIERFRGHSVMSEINEELVRSFVDFLRSEDKAEVTVAKYVDRLKVIYKEYCDQYGLAYKARYFDKLDIKSNEGPRNIVHLSNHQYQKLRDLRFSPEEKRLEITRDIFILLCNTSLYYNDLIKLNPQNAFDQNLLKENPNYLALQGDRKKNDESFWVPLNQVAKEIFFKYYCPVCINIFPSNVAISDQKFNQKLKVLANKINFEESLSVIVGRKTFGTMVDKLEMALSDIKIMYGHSPGSVVKKHYTERKSVVTYLRILSFIEKLNEEEKQTDN